jgi:hypothetical protein
VTRYAVTIARGAMHITLGHEAERRETVRS